MPDWVTEFAEKQARQEVEDRIKVLADVHRNVTQ